MLDMLIVMIILLQAYYRRASANMALGKFKLALADFETVCSGITLHRFVALIML
jgi:hypothetical protein